MPKHLPVNPNLEHLKKQAKQLVKDHKAGQVDAFARIKASFPRLVDASVHEILSADFTLCNAQLVISREYGFDTWNDLAEAVKHPEASSFQDAFVGDIPETYWGEAQVKQAASTALPVLISGESGTCKGVIARTIHALSARKDRSFVQVNCSTRPDILLESELFGHEKGAFTGAQAQRTGKVEAAQGGTLLLDEVGGLPTGLQGKMLRLLEESAFDRVGGTERLQADVRVIAVTNQPIEDLVAAGSFRQDLAFLLQKVSLVLPPLRERREAIPMLANHFAAQMATHLNKAVPQLSDEVVSALQAHDWPGNIRELEHRVQRAVAGCEAVVIQRADLALD